MWNVHKLAWHWGCDPNTTPAVAQAFLHPTVLWRPKHRLNLVNRMFSLPPHCGIIFGWEVWWGGGSGLFWSLLSFHSPARWGVEGGGGEKPRQKTIPIAMGAPQLLGLAEFRLLYLQGLCWLFSPAALLMEQTHPYSQWPSSPGHPDLLRLSLQAPLLLPKHTFLHTSSFLLQFCSGFGV